MSYNNSNIMLFCIILIFGFFLTVPLFPYLKQTVGIKTASVLSLLYGAVFISLVLTSYFYLPIQDCKPVNKEETYSSPQSGNYNTLNGGNRLLEIEPVKKCCGGMNEQACKETTQEQLDCTCCDPKKGLIGRRHAQFEYTPQSDLNWQDKRCKSVGDDKTCLPTF